MTDALDAHIDLWRAHMERHSTVTTTDVDELEAAGARGRVVGELFSAVAGWARRARRSAAGRAEDRRAHRVGASDRERAHRGIDAELGAQEWRTDDLFALVRRAASIRDGAATIRADGRDDCFES